jgi:hypothetical protein
MIIIAGHSIMQADRCDAAVRAFGEMVERARLRDGCLETFTRIQNVIVFGLIHHIRAG